jgi:hypothetical protein
MEAADLALAQAEDLGEDLLGVLAEDRCSAHRL